MSWKDLRNLRNEVEDLFSDGVFSLADVHTETGFMGIARGPHLRTHVVTTKIPTDRHYLDPTQRKRRRKETKKAWRQRTGYYAKRYARRKEQAAEALGQVWRKASAKYQAKKYAEMTPEERKVRNREKRARRDPLKVKAAQKRYYDNLTKEQKTARETRHNELRRAAYVPRKEPLTPEQLSVLQGPLSIRKAGPLLGWSQAKVHRERAKLRRSACP